MEPETWTFEGATINVNGVATDPMRVEVLVGLTDGHLQGSGTAALPESVLAEVEKVDGAAKVVTAKGDTFKIMIRKAYLKEKEIEFVTSGRVPEA